MAKDSHKEKEIKKANVASLRASKIIVSQEQATNEFYTWMRDWRRLEDRLIDDKDGREAIESCIAHIMYGKFKIDPNTGIITQKLIFPIGEEFGEEDSISELNYKPRLNGNAFNGARKYKNADEDMKIRSMMATLSGVQQMLVLKADPADITPAGDLMFFYFLG